MLLSTIKPEEKTVQEKRFTMFIRELFLDPFSRKAQVRENEEAENSLEGEFTGIRYFPEEEVRLHDTLFRKNPPLPSFNFSNQELKNLFGWGVNLSDDDDVSFLDRRDVRSVNRFRPLPEEKEKQKEKLGIENEQEAFLRDLLKILKIKNEKREITGNDTREVKEAQLKDWLEAQLKGEFQVNLQKKEKTQKIERLKEAIVKQNEIKVAVHQEREEKRDVLKSEAEKQVFDQGHLMEQRNQLLRQVYSYNDLLSRPALLGLDKNDITMFEEKLRDHWFQLTAIDQTIQQLNSAVQYAQGEVFFLGSLGDMTQA